MDPPPAQTMLTALEPLSALDDEELLTRLGKKMADFLMGPLMAKVVIASVEFRLLFRGNSFHSCHAFRPIFVFTSHSKSHLSF